MVLNLMMLPGLQRTQQFWLEPTMDQTQMNWDNNGLVDG